MITVEVIISSLGFFFIILGIGKIAKRNKLLSESIQYSLLYVYCGLIILFFGLVVFPFIFSMN